MSVPQNTTGRLAYFKLALMAKLMRGGYLFGLKIGQWTGQFPPITIPKPLETLSIRSTKGNRSVRAYVHRNKAAQKAFEDGKPTAVHIHWYGGGWILPYHPSQTAGIVNALLDAPELADYPLTIVEATYGLAPEHASPGDLEDAKDVYSYFASHPRLYDPNRITISGASSGGAIALGLSVMLSQERRQNPATAAEAATTGHPVKGVVALYPMVSWIDILRKVKDFSVKPPQEEKRTWPGNIMPDFIMDIIMVSHFFSPASSWAKPLSTEDEGKRKDELMHRPSVSPALADVVDFPPSVKIWTAEYDVMSLDADELRAKIEARDGGAQKGMCGKHVKGIAHAWDVEVVEGQIGWEEKNEALQSLVEVVARAGGVKF